MKSDIPPIVLVYIIIIITVATAALGLAPNCLAQASPQEHPKEPVSVLLDDPTDKRFVSVSEDWTTPAMTGTHLMPALPLRMIDDSHAGYTLELIRLQWRWADPMDVYLLLPKGVKNPPVILNLYGYPIDTDQYKNEIFQEALVKDGFAAVGMVSALTGHRYHGRPMAEWFLSELQESLGKSAHDVQMILDYLASRGDVDMNRVGMFGQGSGGTIAILASGVDPRIKVLDVLDPWGDWSDWIAGSRFVPEQERADYLKPEFLAKAATLETLDWLPKIQAKKFRFQQDIFELDTPPAAKAKLRSAAPPGTRFAFYQNFKEFLAVFTTKSTDLDWVKHELRVLPLTTAAAPQH
jgi:hypothetical protein